MGLRDVLYDPVSSAFLPPGQVLAGVYQAQLLLIETISVPMCRNCVDRFLARCHSLRFPPRRREFPHGRMSVTGIGWGSVPVNGRGGWPGGLSVRQANPANQPEVGLRA